MTTDLRFSGRRREDGTEVLAVTGEIDMSNSDAFARPSRTPPLRAACWWISRPWNTWTRLA